MFGSLVIASALYKHILLGGSRLSEVRFVLYDRPTLELFIDSLDGLLLAGEDDLDREGALPRSSELALDQTFYVREPVSRRI